MLEDVFGRDCLLFDLFVQGRHSEHLILVCLVVDESLVNCFLNERTLDLTTSSLWRRYAQETSQLDIDEELIFSLCTFTVVLSFHHLLLGHLLLGHMYLLVWLLRLEVGHLLLSCLLVRVLLSILCHWLPTKLLLVGLSLLLELIRTIEHVGSHDLLLRLLLLRLLALVEVGCLHLRSH